MKNSRTVGLVELEPYITQLHNELDRMGYSDSFTRRMRSVWQPLLEYAKNNPDTIFNSEFRQKFTLDYFGHCLGDKHPAFVVNRALSMLSDYIDYGMVFQQSCNKGQDFLPGYKELFDKFLLYLKDVRRLSDGSITHGEADYSSLSVFYSRWESNNSVM